MNVDGYQLLVEFECGRTLPGWVPRRLGLNFQYNNYTVYDG